MSASVQESKSINDNNNVNLARHVSGEPKALNYEKKKCYTREEYTQEFKFERFLIWTRQNNVHIFGIFCQIIITIIIIIIIIIIIKQCQRVLLTLFETMSVDHTFSPKNEILLFSHLLENGQRKYLNK